MVFISPSESPIHLRHQRLCAIHTDTLSNRYPRDYPQGTAVPHWAFFDVTVRDLFHLISFTLTFGEDAAWWNVL